MAGPGEHVGGEVLKRGHVGEDPGGAAVCAHQKVVVAGVDEDVVDWDDGQVVLELCPTGATVHGHEHTDLVADEKQVRGAVMLGYDVYRPAVGQTIGDAGPVLAVILAYVHICGVVTVAVAVEGGVDPPCLVRGGFEATDVGALGQPGDAIGHVGPRRAIVAAHLDIAIVGADIKQSAASTGDSANAVILP